MGGGEAAASGNGVFGIYRIILCSRCHVYSQTNVALVKPEIYGWTDGRGRGCRLASNDDDDDDGDEDADGDGDGDSSVGRCSSASGGAPLKLYCLHQQIRLYKPPAMLDRWIINR